MPVRAVENPSELVKCSVFFFLREDRLDITAPRGRGWREGTCFAANLSTGVVWWVQEFGLGARATTVRSVVVPPHCSLPIRPHKPVPIFFRHYADVVSNSHFVLSLHVWLQQP